jgi:small-conductance mechanosensitive channel
MDFQPLIDTWQRLLGWEQIELFLIILFYFIVAWIAARLLPDLVSRTMLAMAQRTRRRPLSMKRQTTIYRLGRDLTRFMIFGLAAILSLALFVDTRGLFTFLGLFSAGFGLGARPLVSDYLSGAVYLFEDTFAIGDKVEVMEIEGTVEDIRLRTSVIRSMTGELYYVPNGEIRVVRNFARGTFSEAGFTLYVSAAKLDDALAHLDEMVLSARERIPTLLEEPRIIAGDAAVSDRVELRIAAKAQYGCGPETRRELVNLTQHTLRSLEVDVRE